MLTSRRIKSKLINTIGGEYKEDRDHTGVRECTLALWPFSEVNERWLMIQDVVWTLLTVAEHYSGHYSLYMNQLELEPQLNIVSYIHLEEIHQQV